MIYLDASALVTYLTGRTNSSELRAFLLRHADDRGATSTVGFIETVRTCDFIGSFRNLMAELLSTCGELEVTAEIRDRAANLTGGLTTLDAIHVATAELVAEDVRAFVTYDRRLAAVARSRGLPVASPGT